MNFMFTFWIHCTLGSPWYCFHFQNNWNIKWFDVFKHCHHLSSSCWTEINVFLKQSLDNVNQLNKLKNSDKPTQYTHYTHIIINFLFTLYSILSDDLFFFNWHFNLVEKRNEKTLLAWQNSENRNENPLKKVFEGIKENRK